MAIDFPSSPNVNDTHTEAGLTWIWTGEKWTTNGNYPAFEDVYVNKTGDNMTGDLTLGTDKITLNAGDGSASFAGDVKSKGKVLTRTVELQLEADDDTKYTSTTNEEGETELVYNGAVLDVKDRLTKLDTALTGLKAALASTTDHASLKAALIAALSDI